MDIQKVYISFSGIDIKLKMDVFLSENSLDDIRRVNQALEKGNEIWRSWVITVGGDIISLGGTEGRIAVGADHLEDLEAIKTRYSGALDAQVSVGVGLTVNESDKALRLSKATGPDKITFYTPEMEEELKELENPEPEEPLHFLGKSEHPLKNQFEQIIQEQEEAVRAKEAEAEQQTQTGQMKAAVVQILQQVRQNTKELESLKEEAPHLYQSIMSMTQALIMMARSLQAQPQSQPMAKSETPKVKHFTMHYPVGFMLPPGPGTHGKQGGKIKVVTTDGRTKWHSVRAGMILAQDGTATSSRNGV